MLIYTFGCKSCGNSLDISRQMGDTTPPICQCGQQMSRVFSMPLINWKGRAPSQGEIPPAIQRHINTASQRLEKVQEKYERGNYGTSISV